MNITISYIYKRTTADAIDRPAPVPTKKIKSSLIIFLFSRAKAKARGIEAATQLPVLDIIFITCPFSKPPYFEYASTPRPDA